MTDLGDFDSSTSEGDVGPVPIGTLTVREGLRLSADGDGTRLEAYITPEHRDDIQLRSYAVVALPSSEGDPQAQLFCRIDALRYAHEFATDDATAIHARRAMDREGIDERDYKFIASLQPLATVIGDPTDREGAMQRRRPDTLPKPDTAVRPARYDPEIKTGLNLPQEGLFIGHLAVGGQRVRTAAEPPTVDYRLRDADVADPLVFRHVLVAGGTGSGKTHTAKNILRQLMAEDRRYDMPGDKSVEPALVIIDPQDEYAQLHDDNPAIDDSYRRRLTREQIAYGGVEDTATFVPVVAGTSYSPMNHRAEQVQFSLPFALVEDNPWLIAGARLNEQQFNGLTDLLGAYFGSTEAPTYDGFMDFLDDEDAVTPVLTRSRMHEETFDAILRRVKRSTFARAFDQSAPPITDLIDRFVRRGGISTVPTYHLESESQRTLVVLALSSLLIDEKLTSDPEYRRIADTPLVLAMDEAHNYLIDAETVQAQRTITKFTEAAKQGRKERLGLFLVTQDPGDIADAIFKQLNTRIALNLADEEAIASLNLPASLSRQVPDLETGEAVVYSPDNAESVQVIGLERCVVKHAPR